VQSEVPASASREAAASAAAHEALVNLFPATASSFDTLYAAILAAIPDGHKRPQASCGVNSSQTKFSPRGPMMVPTPLSSTRRQRSWRMGVDSSGISSVFAAAMGFVAPFAMITSSQFRPPGPPSLDSERYAADYNEVKELGAAVGSTRTEDQTTNRLVLGRCAGTETPPATGTILRRLSAAAQGNTLEENASCLAY